METILNLYNLLDGAETKMDFQSRLLKDLGVDYETFKVKAENNEFSSNELEIIRTQIRLIASACSTALEALDKELD